jgi:hypothetical protein
VRGRFTNALAGVAGVGASMHRKHDDVVVQHAEVDRVRKAPEYCASDLAGRNWKRQWVLDDSINVVLDGFAELQAKPFAARFVPARTSRSSASACGRKLTARLTCGRTAFDAPHPKALPRTDLRCEPITYVSDQMGHKDSAITLRVYAHWLPDSTARKSV